MNRALLAGGAFAAAAWAVRRSRKPSNIRGQTVLITGGSRGLGLAMAREFGRHRCRVAICARDQAELERAAKMLRDDNVDVFAVPCDVSDRGQVDQMIQRVRERYGRIDILVANAGEILVAPIENVTHADFERAMAVMFWGVIHPALAVLPDMRARRSGRIAAITSIGGKVSVPHLLPYSCAKFAAVAFCEGLRAEMAPHGVKVTTIAPGLMRTGSYVNAQFKGQYVEEGAWFSTAASMPLITISAERAARQAVAAIRRGRAERILSTQANLLARAHGLFPEFVQNMLGLVSRALPGAAANSSIRRSGADVQKRSGWLRAFTILGRRAGARLNQPA